MISFNISTTSLVYEVAFLVKSTAKTPMLFSFSLKVNRLTCFYPATCQEQVNTCITMVSVKSLDVSSQFAAV